jgi:hypothetical protein
MKIKKIIAVFAAAIMALALAVPAFAEVPNSTDEGASYLYTLTRKYDVLKPGSAKLNAMGEIERLDEHFSIEFQPIDTTKPITIKIVSTTKPVTYFDETFVIDGDDQTFIPNGIDANYWGVYFPSGIFPNDSGIITFSGSVSEYLCYYETSAELADDISENAAYYIAIRNNGGFDVTTSRTISDFVAPSESTVYIPYRSAPNGFSSSSTYYAPKEIFSWLEGFALPDFEYGGEQEVIAAFAMPLALPVYTEPVYDDIYSASTYPYDVVKKDSAGKLVIDETRMSTNNYRNVRALFNDNFTSYDTATVTFNTAIDKVITPEYLATLDAANEVSHSAGMYVTGTDDYYGKLIGDDKYMKPFSQSLFNLYGDDASLFVPFDVNKYFTNGLAYNLFTAGLIVNNQYTMQLAQTSMFNYNATSLSFDISAMYDNVYTNVNPYLYLITDMRLATSIPWYWESVEFKFFNTDNSDDELEVIATDELE